MNKINFENLKKLTEYKFYDEIKKTKKCEVIYYDSLRNPLLVSGNEKTQWRFIEDDLHELFLDESKSYTGDIFDFLDDLSIEYKETYRSEYKDIENLFIDNFDYELTQNQLFFIYNNKKRTRVIFPQTETIAKVCKEKKEITIYFIPCRVRTYSLENDFFTKKQRLI